MHNSDMRSLALAVLLPLLCASISGQPTPTLISKAFPSLTPPAGGSGDSAGGMISSDNNWVVFCSAADDLVTNDFNRSLDVFIRNRENNSTVLVSLNMEGNESGNGDSSAPIISPDGRYILFSSRASNLVENDHNKAPDLFVRDIVQGRTSLVTANSSGTGSSTAAAVRPRWSADSRRIIFESGDSDLVDGDFNRVDDLFMRDLVASKTTRLTVSYPGAPIILPTFLSPYEPAISANGERIVYTSSLNSLVRNDNNQATDIFLWENNQNFLVSVSTNGSFGNGASFTPLISPDGRYVAFRSRASNLVPGVFGTNWFVRDLTLHKTFLLDPKREFLPTNARAEITKNGVTFSTGFQEPRSISEDGNSELIVSNPQSQIYLRDKIIGVQTLVSVDDGGTAGDGPSFEPQFTEGDRVVLFSSQAFNITRVPVEPHLMLRHLEEGTNVVITQNFQGSAPARFRLPFEGFAAAVSEDGLRIAYQARGIDLVPNATVGRQAIYLYDSASRSNLLVSVDSSNTTLPNGDSSSPSITTNGRFVVFTSRGTNLVSGFSDANVDADLFLRDILTATTFPLTVHHSGTSTPMNASADHPDFNPAISADARLVAFQSPSPQIHPRDTTTTIDIFVRDTLSGTNILVSESLSGVTGGNRHSHSPLISSDGRFVAFRSTASNLVPNGTTNEALYLRDLQLGTTTILPGEKPIIRPDQSGITLPGGIVLGTGFWEPSSLSMDSRFEAYLSNSNGARTNSRTGTFQVYLQDHLTGTNELVSRNEFGPAGWCDGATPAVSPDGRFVVFESMDSSLVENDVNQAMDLFLFDSLEKTVELISARHPDRFPASANRFSSFLPGALSQSAGAMVFVSWATNLVEDDTNEIQDIFLHDFATGSNWLVSASSDSLGSAAGYSGEPILTGDGRHVVMASAAPNLLPGDTNSFRDIFIRNVQTGAITLVSHGREGAFPNGHSYQPSASHDGRFIAFTSLATNIAEVSDPNRLSDVFVRDLETGTTRTVSLSITNLPAPRTAYGISHSPVISPDGRWVAFVSFAYDLVTNPPPGTNLYLADLHDGSKFPVAPVSTPPSFSSDGRLVLFETVSTFSHLPDVNLSGDIFLLNTVDKSIELISVNQAGEGSGNSRSRSAALSADGRFIVFSSLASDLVPNDTNETEDVFLRDRLLRITRLVSRSKDGAGSANGPSDAPVISSDGRYVAFRSSANNLGDDPVRADGQIYARDLLTGKTILVSRSLSKTGSSNARSGPPLISADGTKILFKTFATDLALAEGNTSQDLFYLRTTSAEFGDADADGLDDSWEQQHFGDLASGGDADSDQDGQTDRAEFLAGTDPQDPASLFEGKSIIPSPDGLATLRWTAIPGLTYQVQYKDDLNQFFWNHLAAPILATSNEAEILDTTAETSLHRYYRIIVVR